MEMNTGFAGYRKCTQCQAMCVLETSEGYVVHDGELQEAWKLLILALGDKYRGGMSEASILEEAAYFLRMPHTDEQGAAEEPVFHDVPDQEDASEDVEDVSADE